MIFLNAGTEDEGRQLLQSGVEAIFKLSQIISDAGNRMLLPNLTQDLSR